MAPALMAQGGWYSMFLVGQARRSLLFVRPEHAIRNRRRRRQVAFLVLGMDSNGYAMEEVLEGLRR